MKTILLFLFLSISTIVLSQNYRTINTGQTTYYQSTQIWPNETYALNADSFEVNSNGDTTCYLNQIMPDFSGIQYFYDSISQEYCLQTEYDNMFGRKVIIHQNGNDIYFNNNNEPITIRTNAQLNENWWMFENDTLRVKAMVTQITSTTIFNTIDSVKSIDLQVYDTLNNPISHHLNNSNYIQISKNYGFLSSVELKRFPYFENIYQLEGVQNSKLGIYNIKRNDVYNFDIGDEFHISTTHRILPVSQQSNYYKVIISGKTLDSLGNWSYNYNVVRHVSSYEDFMIDTTLVEEIIPGNIPSPLIPSNVVNNLPRIFYIHENQALAGYSTIYPNAISNRMGKIVELPYWDFDNDSCWTDVLVSAGIPNKYFDGLGGPYGQSFGSVYTNVALVYYQKGNETYGTPINFNMILPTKRIVSKSDILKIYPNPAQNFVNVELQNYSNIDFKLFIINNLGQVVQEEIVSKNLQKILIYHLPKGIYTIQIENESMIYTRRLLID